MVQGRATLIVDLGNSSTKGMVMFGRDSQTGKYRERRFDLSNVFATVRRDYVVSPDYSDTTSTILHVDTTLNGRRISGNYCNGELQEHEFSSQVIKPSALDKKYNLDSTVLSLRLSFLFACKAIMNIQRVSDFGQLSLTWNVVTLLPPGDIDNGREKMMDLVRNITEVESVFPEATIPIHIDKVSVFPEGFCAYAGVVYDKGQIYRPDYKFLTNETVMVFDIGAGTTDCMLIKNNKLVQASKYTVQLGGNNVYQIVRRNLRENGIDLNSDVIMKGVWDGLVKDGSKEVSIVDLVNNAKNVVANRIISEFQEFIESSDTKLRSVGYIIICGGGSMRNSDASSIVPLSAKVIGRIKELSPNTELVLLPTNLTFEDLPDGGSRLVERQMNPRDLNVIGAGILAEAL